MGILAPLTLQTETPEEVCWVSGEETVKVGVWLLFFGLTVLLMWVASKPLLRNPSIQDPLLQVFVPNLLLSLSALIFLSALGLIGYKRSILIQAKRRNLRLRTSIWQVPLSVRNIGWSDISTCSITNVTPKGYRPEWNKKNRPVGYWEIHLRPKQGKEVLLDRAPAEEEIRQFAEKLEKMLEMKKGTA